MEQKTTQQSDSPGNRKRRPGRPCVSVLPQEVKALRDGGMSWRQIARHLGIGTATAMRLYVEAADESKRQGGVPVELENVMKANGWSGK